MKCEDVSVFFWMDSQSQAYTDRTEDSGIDDMV
jgi:hypothetical protein